MGMRQDNDDTSNAARSYYEKFNLSIFEGYQPSQFQVAIEYKSPEIVPVNERKVAVNWYNLLFTSSLSIQKKDSKDCQGYEESRIGFVELVETDTAWYKYKNTGMEHGDWNLKNNRDLQYVMTKPSQYAKHMFADGSAVTLYPVSYDRIVPLKYESSENIAIDFRQYPETLEYEKLVEKKIFLVQIGPSDQVLQVIAGVDVMMYVNYVTYNVTDAVHLTLNKNHSLIQWIVNPEKYFSVLGDKNNHKFRDRELTYVSKFLNPSVTTLNPLLNGQRISYTAE